MRAFPQFNPGALAPEPALMVGPSRQVGRQIPPELAHCLGLAAVAKALGIDHELELPAFVTCEIDEPLAMQPPVAQACMNG